MFMMFSLPLEKVGLVMVLRDLALSNLEDLVTPYNPNRLLLSQNAGFL